MAKESKDVSKEEYRQNRDTVYTYFYYANRPVALSEVVLQFKTIKKSVVEKILGDLVSKEKIMAKLLGKSKFYCLAQDMEYRIEEEEGYNDDIDAQMKEQNGSSSGKDGEDEKTLRYLRWKLNNLKEIRNVLWKENSALSEEITGYENELSVDELKHAIENMKKIVQENEGAEEIKVVDENAMEQKRKEHAAIKKINSVRKKIFKEIVDGVSEGIGCKSKELMEDAGIEL
ncbi:26S proteasome regulatory subunit, ATPase 3, interacting protein [Enteropsectra breve]|nr:26S proteasome regulatory subunit, ATPase 3, interacting protein [Enteropsectra breve]